MNQKILILALAAIAMACGKSADDFNEEGIPSQLTFKVSAQKALSAADVENLKNIFETQGKSLLESSYTLVSNSKEDLTTEQKNFVVSVRNKCAVTSNPPTTSSTTINEIKVGDVKTTVVSASISGESCPVENGIKAEGFSKVSEVLDKSKGYFRGDASLKLNSSSKFKEESEKINAITFTTALTGKTVIKEKGKALYLKGRIDSSLSNKSIPLSSFTGIFQYLNIEKKNSLPVDSIFNGELKTIMRTYKLDLAFMDGNLHSAYVDGNKMPNNQVVKMFSKFNLVNSIAQGN